MRESSGVIDTDSPRPAAVTEFSGQAGCGLASIGSVQLTSAIEDKLLKGAAVMFSV